MKNRLFKKIMTSATIGAFITPIVCLGTISCKNKEAKIESISLDARQLYVFVGDSLQINPTIYPEAAQNNPITWEILTPTDGVTITNDGLLRVDESVSYVNPVSVVVSAYDSTNSDIFSLIEISVSNFKNSNFLGFVDGNIYYKDRYLNETALPIKQKNEYEFETDGKVDFFASNLSETIYFLPVFKTRQNELMKFHLVGNEHTVHGIQWAGDYHDNDWTTTIPKINASLPYIQNDVIEVSFACDENIIFRIHCRIWASRGTIGGGLVSYVSKESDDPHKIGFIGTDNTYSISMFWNPETKKDTLNNLLFYKPLYEYLDLVFFISYDDIPVPVQEIIEPQLNGLPERIRNNYVEREFDNYPAYSLNNFTLDFSDKYFEQYFKKEDEVALFTIYGVDPIRPTTKSFILNFNLEI